MFEKLCVAGAELNDPLTAFREIDRVLAACQRYKRPVYLEIPRETWFTSAPSNPRRICNIRRTTTLAR